MKRIVGATSWPTKFAGVLILFNLVFINLALAQERRPLSCATWLQNFPLVQVEQEILTAQQTQGMHYLRQAYHDHSLLGKTFVLPQARATALAPYWPGEQAYVDDFLPNLKAALTPYHWPKDPEIAAILQEAEQDLLDLTGGELQITLKLYKYLAKQVDCLRQRSQPIVQEALQRIDQLLLNLQEEQVELWPNLKKRTQRWPSYTTGHQFTLALRTFLLNVQQTVIVLAQQIKQDNLITLPNLMQYLGLIEQALATYPRFMAEYLQQHPWPYPAEF